jgi:hypothetical protein
VTRGKTCKSGIDKVSKDRVMPCKEYEQMESMQKMQRNTWARFTYRENAHLRGGVSQEMAKELAKQARARITEIGKQMHWPREYCKERKQR